MQQIWENLKLNLQTIYTPQIYSTWIENIYVNEDENEELILFVRNRFQKDWIVENYLDDIKKELKKYKDVTIKIEIESNNKNATINKKTKAIKKVSTSKKIVNKNNGLNDKYNFDFFVSGSSNQFAHAAAMAVATAPAITYNPLFIYGGVGLGKTHLINAIGNQIIKNNPDVKVAYYTSEKFMNELINSIRLGKMDDFRNKFRNIDVLLIDDVQFLAGKERTQEEFFHTFNSLYDSNKQIVVTSDKFPKEIPGIEERLRSRFEWGLIADIQSPDIETKLAILKVKAKINGIDLPDDIAFFLANTFATNIRVLEGYLVRIAAFSSLTSTEITIETVKEILKDVISDKKKEVSIEKIQKVVANFYNIKVSELKSQKRLKNLVFPRQIAMYITRQITSSSYPEIGSKFGGKDHSTIIYAIKKIEKLMKENSATEQIVRDLIEILEA